MQVDPNCVVQREARGKQLGLPNRFVRLFFFFFFGLKNVGRFIFILLRALVSTTIDAVSPGLLSHHCLLL